MVAQTCFTDLIIYDHQDVADPTQKLLALFPASKKDCWSFFGGVAGDCKPFIPKKPAQVVVFLILVSQPCYVR